MSPWLKINQIIISNNNVMVMFFMIRVRVSEDTIVNVVSFLIIILPNNHIF